jgi:hypothetical protein
MRIATFTRRQFVRLLSAIGAYRFLGLSPMAKAPVGGLDSSVYVPSFYEDIKPLFTHYDRIKMMYLLDVWDHEQVKALAPRILESLLEDPNRPGWSLLPGVRRMPLYAGPWTEAQLQLFRSWIDTGCKPGTLPPTPQPSSTLSDFLSLSKILTGFDDLDEEPELAQSYLNLCSAYAPKDVDSLLSIWKTISGLDEAARDKRIEEDIMSHASRGPAARRIILLWYTGGLYRTDGSVEQLKEGYVRSLVWRASKAHPMGYADEAVDFYWQHQPEAIRHTGLQLARNRTALGGAHNARV